MAPLWVIPAAPAIGARCTDRPRVGLQLRSLNATGGEKWGHM